MKTEVALGAAATALPKLVSVGNDVWVVFEWDGKLRALEERCSHRAGPLSEGLDTHSGCAHCPWHGAKFDLRTGEVLQGPARRRLRTGSVREAAGQWYLQEDAR